MGDKQYRPWSPRQGLLLPPSPLDWLPEGHLAYFILELVAELDLGEIERAIQAKDSRGTRPYSPGMMVSLLVYAYCVGVYSSRKIERATHEDVAFRVLAAGQHPFFTTINEFRKTHLCTGRAVRPGAAVVPQGGPGEAGARGGGRHEGAGCCEQAQGDELPADERGRGSSARPGGRAWPAPRRWTRKRTRASVRDSGTRTFRRSYAGVSSVWSASVRPRHSSRPMPGRAAPPSFKNRPSGRASGPRTMSAVRRRAGPMRPEPASAKSRPRLSRTQRRMRGAEAESFVTEEGLPKHRVRALPDGTPHPKAQRNFVDPDSRIQESGGSFLQGYNCQLAVDEEHQIIVAQAVTNQPPDNGNLLPLLDQVQEHCEESPRTVTADAGYWFAEVAAQGQRRGTSVYVATDRRRHGTDPSPPEPESEQEPTAKDLMRAKLFKPEGRAIYARRKAVVKQVTGQIKEARGFRRFLLRGLHAVSGQSSLVCTGHNVLKLYRATCVQA